MKTRYLKLFSLMMLTFMLMGQYTPSPTPHLGALTTQRAEPELPPPPLVPPNMGDLAIHFKGVINGNIPLDATFTSQGSNSTDPLLQVRVISIVQSGNDYLVQYLAQYSENPPSIAPVVNAPGQYITSVRNGAAGTVYLKPNVPVMVIKSLETQLTLTLTE